MILHSEKCHYMCIGRNCADDAFLHNGKKFENSKEETILAVIIDNKLSFDSHIKRICKKAGLSGSLHFHEYQLSLIWIKAKSYSKAWLNRKLLTAL